MRAVEGFASARESAESGSGTDLAMERFAGLYLDPREVARLASRPPGEFGSLVRGKHNEEPEPLTDVMPPNRVWRDCKRARLRLAVRGRRLAARIACEIDPKYEKIYAFLQDDVTRKWPTVGLALGLLCTGPAVRLERLGSFAPTGRLARYGLIVMIPDGPGHQTPLPARGFRVDEAVFDYLALHEDRSPGTDAFAPLLEPPDKAVKLDPKNELAGQTELLEAIHRARSRRGGDISARGIAGSGKTTLVRRVSSKLRLRLLSIDLGRLATASFAAAQAMGRSLARETQLRRTLVHLVADDPALAAALYADPRTNCARGEPQGESGSGDGGRPEALSGRGARFSALAELGHTLLRLPKQTVIILETSARRQSCAALRAVPGARWIRGGRAAHAAGRCPRGRLARFPRRPRLGR